MARAKKFVLTSDIPNEYEKLSDYARSVPKFLYFVLGVCVVAVSLTSLQAMKNGALPVGWGVPLWVLSIGCQFFILFSPYLVKRERQFDLTRSLWGTPSWAIVLSASLFFIVDYQFIMQKIMSGEFRLFTWMFVYLSQCLIMLPFAICISSYLKYGSRFRFIAGILLKIIYSQFKHKAVVVRRALGFLRWIYGKLGRYPILHDGIAVSIELISKEREGEQKTLKFSFLRNIYTSKEDIAEGCFVAKEYLILTRMVDEQAQRPWSKGAVEYLNSMISNPKFYSEHPVHYSTYKRTSRELAEYGETLFRTEEDVYFETY